MRTIQITIDEALLEQVDQVTQSLGIARSQFVRAALEAALWEKRIAVLEYEQQQGYARHPLVKGEFESWQDAGAGS